MNLDEFARHTGIIRATELDRVRLLAFYFHKTQGQHQFTSKDVLSWFNALHLPRPNTTRLFTRIRESRKFIKGGANGAYKLHAIELDELQAEYPGLRSESEEVVSTDTILPHPIYESTRGFVESLSKQINASYEYNLFDGCAVLMRRLLEVLLILTYEHLGLEATIQNSSSSYLPLERIIADAKINKTLRLSRDSKALIDEFRQIGNFSAHKIYYNCRRSDLKKIIVGYRAAIEELLYKSGIRT